MCISTHRPFFSSSAYLESLDKTAQVTNSLIIQNNQLHYSSTAPTLTKALLLKIQTLWDQSATGGQESIWQELSSLVYQTLKIKKQKNKAVSVLEIYFFFSFLNIGFQTKVWSSHGLNDLHKTFVWEWKVVMKASEEEEELLSSSRDTFWNQITGIQFSISTYSCSKNVHKLLNLFVYVKWKYRYPQLRKKPSKLWHSAWLTAEVPPKLSCYCHRGKKTK